MTFEVPQCYSCRNFIGAKTCKAFKQIPLEIFINTVVHNKPYKGDHGIQFEAKPKKSWKGFY